MIQYKGAHFVCICVTLGLVIVISVVASTDSVRGWTFGLRYADCRKMCERTVYCDIVRYIKRYPLCLLYSENNIPSRKSGVTTRLEKSQTRVSLCSVCKGTYFCDILNTNEAICTPAQCQVPVVIPGAEVKGNMLTVGSKAQYKCIETSIVYSVKCLPDALWSETSSLLCNCKLPDGDHHATIRFEMVNESYIALALDCHGGYELLEMEKPKCNLLNGEWFGLDLSGCYMIRVPPWRKIYSYTTKLIGSIIDDFRFGESRHFSFEKDVQKDGQFRNSTVFENWSTTVTKRIRLDVVVDWKVGKYMVFNGTESNWNTWFETSRLLESSWVDLDSNTHTKLFTIIGITRPWNARFLVTKYIDDQQCELDRGWLVICWRYYPCDTSKPGINILYAKGTTVAKFDSSELGFADRFEIWIEE